MHTCPNCKKVFKKKCRLKRHIVTHSNIKPYECVYCKKKFRRKDHLNGHFKCFLAHASSCFCDRCKVHYSCEVIKADDSPEVNSDTFQCLICLELFIEMSSVKHHFLNVHKKEADVLLQIQNQFAERNQKKNLSYNHENVPNKIISVKRSNKDEKLKSKIMKKADKEVVKVNGIQNDNSVDHNRFENFMNYHIYENSADNFVQINTAPVKNQLAVKTTNHKEPNPDYSSVDYVDHTNIVSKNKQYYHCRVCNKSVTSLEAKMGHEMMHDHGSNKNIPCNVCNRTFVEYSKLVRHLRTHTGSKPFSCKYCDKKFARKDHLHSHEVSNCFMKPKNDPDVIPIKKSKKLGLKNGTKRGIECLLCPEMFTDNSKLAAHLLSHKDVYSFDCKFCSRKFSNMTSLYIHEDNCIISSSEEDKMDSVVSSEESEAKVLYNKAKGFHCSICQKSFTNTSNLENYLKGSTCLESMLENAESTTASECVEIVACQKCNLLVETNFLKTHNCRQEASFDETDGCRPYMCCPCNLSFNEESQLQNHIIEKHKVQSFLCCICEVEFDRVSDINLHFKQFHRENGGGDKDVFNHIIQPIKCNFCDENLSLSEFYNHVEKKHAT